VPQHREDRDIGYRHALPLRAGQTLPGVCLTPG
jgi:hypothetical protein